MKSNLPIKNPFTIYKQNPTEFTFYHLEQALNLTHELMKQGVKFSKIPSIFEEKLGYTLDFLFIGEYIYRCANKDFPLTNKLFECDDTGHILLKDYNGDIFVNQYWEKHLKLVSTCLDGEHYSFIPQILSNDNINIEHGGNFDISTSSLDSTYKWNIIAVFIVVAIGVSAKILYEYMSCKQPGRDHVAIKSNTDLMHENANSDTVFNSSYETSFHLNNMVKVLITFCIPTFIIFLYVYRYYYYYLLTIRLQQFINIFYK